MRLKPGEPLEEELMKLGLANPDRRIGPDPVKPEIIWKVLGGSNLNIGQAIVLGVVDTELAGPLIDLDPPDCGLGVALSQGTSDWTIAGTDIENPLIRSGGVGSFRQEDLGARVDSIATENSTIGHEFQGQVRQE